MLRPEILNVFAEGIQALNLGLVDNYYLELDYPQDSFIAVLWRYTGKDNINLGNYGITEEDATLFTEFVQEQLGLDDTAVEVLTD